MGWIIMQTWENLLFCHWEAAPERLRELIPTELELDLFDGRAWLTVLPFQVSHQRFRFFPGVPCLNRYLELNVRTYVKFGDVSGVYFFSLDANHLPSVLGARVASLPYRLAGMFFLKREDEFIFHSKRVFGDSEFSVSYRVDGGTFARTVPGTLDDWLLERYCLFTKLGSLLLRGDISHESWAVEHAKVDIFQNSVAPMGLSGGPQLVHFAHWKKAYIFPLKRALRL